MEFMAEQRATFDTIEELMIFQSAVLEAFKEKEGVGLEIIVPVYTDKPSIKVRLYKEVSPNAVWINNRQLSLN